MTKYKHKFAIYKDQKDEWRWRLRASNGRIVAESGEGYINKSGLLRALRSLASLDVATTKIETVDE